jgi:hypothetical protein
MAQVSVLFSGKTYGTAKQAVEKNQIIQMSGYEDDRYYDDTKPKFMDAFEVAILKNEETNICVKVQAEINANLEIITGDF